MKDPGARIGRKIGWAVQLAVRMEPNPLLKVCREAAQALPLHPYLKKLALIDVIVKKVEQKEKNWFLIEANVSGY
jgi:hypothetical protein